MEKNNWINQKNIREKPKNKNNKDEPEKIKDCFS